jgi:hypothetical protein
MTELIVAEELAEGQRLKTLVLDKFQFPFFAGFIQYSSAALNRFRASARSPLRISARGSDLAY